MANHAVVPVKGFGTSKKRLSPVLSPPERKQLTLAMLANVLCALQIPAVSKTVVVSNDSGLKSVTSKFNAYFLEQRTKGLNAALEETIEWCMKEGAKSVLVLPADIPLLSSTDVERILKMGTGGEPTVVLSSSHDGGTSALFQSSPNLVSMRFGPHSFRKHLRDACSKGARVKLYYSKNLAMDIDTSEDLSTLLEVDRHTEFWKILGSIDLGSR